MLMETKIFMKSAGTRGYSPLARVMTLAVMLLAMAATGAWAQDSFTISFKTTGNSSDGSSAQTTIEGIIAEGADYVSEVSATKVYNAKSGFGIKLGTSSAAGSLTLTLANEVENVTSIVVNAQQYGTGSADRTLKIQDKSYTTTDEFADYTYTYDTPATVSTITLGTVTKRAYIKSVTVNYTASQGGGSEPEQQGTVYTKAVAIADLQQGDILAEGFSLTGSGFIAFADGRYTAVGTTYSSLNMTYYTGTGKNAVITASAFGSDYSFAPKDEKGNAGNAWLVTAKSNSDVTFAGITYAAEPGKYTVTMAAEAGEGWTIEPAEATTTGVDKDTKITATYTGTRHVKSVTAVVKAAKSPAEVTTAPTATTGDIVAGSETALVSGGTATGGTMMYKVTTENTKPTSTEGFSADVPTAKTRAAGTYYVWYYVKADDTHTDSEISATAIAVTVAPATITVTINQSDWESGDSFTKDGVTVSATMIDPNAGNLGGPGTFSTTLGNFTKIVVTTFYWNASGEGWWSSASGEDWDEGTWTGNASSVSFSGDIYGMGMTQTTIVCTIQPAN